MGENEQGGMLRTVVVVGLVALIATIIIGGVIASKASMNKHVTATTLLVDKMANNNETTKGVTDNESKTIFRYGNFDGATKTVEIQGFDSSKPDWTQYSRDLTIPSEYVKDGVTYKVVSIGENSFKGLELTSVNISDNVKTIENSAFADNAHLTNVTIGKGVETIGDGSFQNTPLSSVTVPDNVKTIGKRAFTGNQNNEDGFVSIGKNTTYSTDDADASFGAYGIWDGTTGWYNAYRPTIRS